MGDAGLKKCHAFICYRQADGLHIAEWLYDKLHGQVFQLERSGAAVELDLYFDHTAPAIDNWRDYWEPKLAVARALVFVCTEGAAKRRDGTDWVYSELDYWLAHKTRAPIVVEATGEGRLHVPRVITERWPAAQRIEWRPQSWPDDDVRRRMERRTIDRIVEGIKLSEQGIYFEELEHLRALNRTLQLETARAEANEERATTAQVSLLVRNGMAAIGDGNLAAAAVWFVEALAIDAGRGFDELAHRVRLHAVTRALPVLRRMWSVDGNIGELRFSESGRLVVLRGAELVALDGSALQVGPRVAALQVGDGDLVQVRSDHELALCDVAGLRELSRWSAGDAQIFDASSAGDVVLVGSAEGLQVVSPSGAAPAWRNGWRAPVESWWRGVLADGRVIAACGKELWSRALADAAPVRLAQGEHIARLVRAADGRVVVASSRKRIWIWRAAGDAIALDLDAEFGKVDEVLDVEVSPDGGHVLATASLGDANRATLIFALDRSPGHHSVARIDHEQAVERWEFTPPRPGGAGSASFAGAKRVDPFEKAARFSPDGRRVALVSKVDHHVRVWDWRSARPLTPPLRILGEAPRAFGFSPDGTAIAIALHDGIAALWEFAQPLGDLPAIHTSDRVDHLVFSPDGARLVLAGYQPQAELWDLERGERTAVLSGHAKAITALAFSADGQRIATGSFDTTVRMFDATSGAEVCAPLAHDDKVDDVCFHGSSRLVTVAGRHDGPSQVRVWDLPAGTLLASLVLDNPVAGLTCSAAGTRVAVLPGRTRPLLWDPVASTSVALATSMHAIEWLAFSDDDTRVWTCAAGQIEEFSSDDGAALRQWSLDSAFPKLLAVSRDGERLALGKWGRQVHIVDRRTGAPLTPPMDHAVRGSVGRGAFSADGRRLFTVCDEQVRVWSADTGELLAPPFVHDVRVNDAALDPAGGRLAISTYPDRQGYAGFPSTVHVWSLSSDARRVDAIRRTAQLASGRRIDSAGGLVPLARSAAAGGHDDPDADHGRLRGWHLEQATHGDDFGRAFHARQMVRQVDLQIAAGDASARLYEQRAAWRRRGGAAAEVADEVLADYAAALALDPENRCLHEARGRFHLELGDRTRGLADLARWLDVRAGHPPGHVAWTDLREVYELALLALLVADRVVYHAVCRRALLLARALPASPSFELWNGTFYACWTAILARDNGLGAGDWTALDAMLARAAAVHQSQHDVPLLLGAFAARAGDAETAEHCLRDLNNHPFDRLFTAFALIRLGRVDEASRFHAVARDEIAVWRARERGRAERYGFAARELDWPDVAGLLEAELSRALTAPR